MKLLSIGDQVEQGTYEQHARFNRATSFRRGDSLVFLVSEEIGAGPLNLVFRADCLEPAKPSPFFITLKANVLSLGESRLILHAGDRYCSSFTAERQSKGHYVQNLAIIKRSILDFAAPRSLAFLLDESRSPHFETNFESSFVRQIKSGAARLFAGDLSAGVALLKGCGLGLTPSGDDFIAGVLIGLNLLQSLHGQDYRPELDEIHSAARGTNLFSNVFLEMARRGRVSETMQNLIAALTTADAETLTAYTHKLLTFGGTSGSDLATGFFMTMNNDAEFISRLRPSFISPYSALAHEIGAQ